MELQEINLDKFKELNSILKNREKFRFTVSDHRNERFRGVKHYRLVNNQFNGKYECLNYVSIDIYEDCVKLHCKGDGSRTPTYKFDQKEIRKLENMTDIDFLEHCIIRGIYAWENSFD